MLETLKIFILKLGLNYYALYYIQLKFGMEE